MKEVDVVVLGTGAAGMVAALAAHDAGARVALYEKATSVESSSFTTYRVRPSGANARWRGPAPGASAVRRVRHGVHAVAELSR